MAKRVGILQPTLEFILSNLMPSSSPKDVDSALHMISVLSDALIKNKVTQFLHLLCSILTLEV